MTGKSSKAWETACPDEESTRRLAADFVRRLEPGDIVLLEGPLGAGKTTFVRGALEGLGYLGIVRSPTFNLIQTFETVPPVLHADLYRVPSEAGLGIEEAAESCISFIEWPDRIQDQGLLERAWRVEIRLAGEGRMVSILSPSD